MKFFQISSHKVTAHKIVKAVIIAPSRLFRFLLCHGIPQVKQAAVIPGCIHIKPLVEAVCRPQAAELVPGKFFIKPALPDKLLQIFHFSLPADCPLHGFDDLCGSMVAVPPQYIQLEFNVCSILHFPAPFFCGIL